VLASTGLVQGCVYFLAHEAWPEDPTAKALIVAPVFFVSVAAAIVHLAWTGTAIKRLATLAAVIPAVFAILGFWVWSHVPAAAAPYRLDESRIPLSIAGTVLAVYVLLPFVQIYQKTGRRTYPYSELFQHSWTNIYILAIGGAVAWAFWIIIVLWFQLFKLIDITLFEDVFTHTAFVSMALAAVFGYGVALGRESERVTSTLRSLTLVILRTLMPLLALIALLFLVSLPFTGLQPLWDTGHASAVLLSLIGLTILLSNGVYQDGTGDLPYERWVRHGVEAALLGLPIYAGITFYALALRIAQYGLSPSRFYGVLLTTWAALYAIGYAAAVLKRRGKWMEPVQRVNMTMAWVLVTSALAAHTPILDPVAWSARNQFARLAEGRVAAQEFDYAFLRFRLGRAGWERLAELEQLTEHPEFAAIRDGVAVAREAESYRELATRATVLLTEDDLELIALAEGFPQGLVSFVATDITRDQTNGCIEGRNCVVFPAALDGDGDNEYVVVLSGGTDYAILAYDRTEDGAWQRIGRLTRLGPDGELPEREVFLDSLRLLGFTPVEVPYRDLEVGEIRLRLRQ
jgi:hypothetical protein